MHELSATKELVRMILEEMETHGLKAPLKISVEIGTLTTFRKDPVLFYFDLLRSEEPGLRGCTLEVSEVQAMVHCGSCRKDVYIEEPILICPECMSTDVTVLQGKDFKLKSIGPMDEEVSEKYV